MDFLKVVVKSQAEWMEKRIRRLWADFSDSGKESRTGLLSESIDFTSTLLSLYNTYGPSQRFIGGDCAMELLAKSRTARKQSLGRIIFGMIKQFFISVLSGAAFEESNVKEILTGVLVVKSEKKGLFIVWG